MIKFPLVFIYFVQFSLVVFLVLFFESSVLFASFAYQFVNKMNVSWNRLYCLLKISDANFLLLLNIDLFSQHWQNQLISVFFLFFCFCLVAASFILYLVGDSWGIYLLLKSFLSLYLYWNVSTVFPSIFSSCSLLKSSFILFVDVFPLLMYPIVKVVFCFLLVISLIMKKRSL